MDAGDLRCQLEQPGEFAPQIGVMRLFDVIRQVGE